MGKNITKLLTISIAAYNVDHYIRKTLDSLVIPEIMKYLEVFVIDDGGYDNTFLIAKEYENKYPGVFFAIHKENRGYGSTVTWSIKHATGKYFKLLDGDDWVDSKGITSLVDDMINVDVDGFITNTSENFQNGIEKNKYDFLKKYNNQIIPVRKAIEFPVVAMWGYTFRTNILKHFYKPLPEHMLYTDQLFVIQALSHVKNFYIISDVVYHWRLGRNEASNNVDSIKKHKDELIKISNKINKYYKTNMVNMNSDTSEYVRKRAAAFYSNSISMLLLLKKNIQNYRLICQWEKEVKRNNFTIYSAANNSKKLRLLRRTFYVAYWIL